MGVGGRWGGGGHVLTFSVCRMGAYLRWSLIRGWPLIQVNTVFTKGSLTQEVVTYKKWLL